MSNKTVYLVVSKMKGTLDSITLAMINYRNANTKGIIDYVPFEEGTTYQDLRDRYITYKPIKGAGGDMTKDGEPYWVLPFWTADGMPSPNSEYAVVLSAIEMRGFDWDIIEDIEL